MPLPINDNLLIEYDKLQYANVTKERVYIYLL